MVTIKLDKPWTYRTPAKTIDYPAGEHEVFQYVADRAEEDGVIASSEIGAPDPLDGSVPELTEYLATVDDMGEIDRLIANERSGKTRSTALDAMQVRKAELTSD